MYFGDMCICIFKKVVVIVWYNKVVLFVYLVFFFVIYYFCGFIWGWNLGSYFER